MAPRISVITPSIRPKSLAINQGCLASQTLQDFEWLTEIGIPRQGYDLNRAYNRMLRRARGQLIVFYQDYIRIPKDGLEKFWAAYMQDAGTFFTSPVGKTMNWRNPKWDWRAHTEGKIDWMRWEVDWAAAPLAALKEIGGFDEWLDEHTWTFDNVNVGLRADMAGYAFGVLRDNPALAFDHDQVMKHPWREKNYHPEFHNQRLDEIRKGLKLDYLTN